MGKHSKGLRKKYVKERKRRLKLKTKVNELQKEGQEEGGTEMDDESSPTDREELEQGLGDGTDVNNKDDSGIFKDCCVDLNDERLFKPRPDPLWVAFYKYTKNKRKLSELLDNPLGNYYEVRSNKIAI